MARPNFRVCSSVVEHPSDKGKVPGSIPGIPISENLGGQADNDEAGSSILPLPTKTRRSGILDAISWTARSAAQYSRTGLSRGRLVKRLGVHPTHVSSLERGIRYPPLKVIERLARILAMPSKDFFK